MQALFKTQIKLTFLALLLLALIAVGCGSGVGSEGAGGVAEGEALRVVATTSIVADVVANVGDDLIDLTVLLPPGTDPHAFEPTPRDVAAIADAHVLFANGLGLEEFLKEMLASAGVQEIAVELSAGVTLLDVVDDLKDEHVDEDCLLYTSPSPRDRS